MISENEIEFSALLRCDLKNVAIVWGGGRKEAEELEKIRKFEKRPALSMQSPTQINM